MPICEIYMMLDGHMEYLKLTSPYRGGVITDMRKAPTPDEVAENVRNVLGSFGNG